MKIEEQPKFIITTANLSPSGSAFYSSIAGAYLGQRAECGIEVRSSELRGYLLAVLQGCMKLQGQFGVRERHVVDVLVPNQELAKQFATKNSASKILDSGDHDLWGRLFVRKEEFDLRFVWSHEQSQIILGIWHWSSVPPVPFFLDKSSASR